MSDFAADLLSNAERLPSEAPFVRRRDVEAASPNVPGCVGCGGYHGAVGEELGCLRRTIERLRAQVASTPVDEPTGGA